MDRERVFAGDRFGVYLEKLGATRELLMAEVAHGPLAILSRRVQLLRCVAPKVADDLYAEGMTIEIEDLEAELEWCYNSQFSYSGYTPYEILYGTNPSDIRDIAQDSSLFVQ